MSDRYIIKAVVEFSERPAAPEILTRTSPFYISAEEANDNRSYCQTLVRHILRIKYGELTDFIIFHCDLMGDPIKWLDKLEMLISENAELFSTSHSQGRMIKCYTIIESTRKEIERLGYRFRKAKVPMRHVNAESEDRYFSFRELKNRVDGMSDYAEKILLLTHEKFEYEQAGIDFLNSRLPDYSEQCQKEIDHIQHLNMLANEFSMEQTPVKNETMPFNRLKINCNVNQLVDIFYRLTREIHVGDKPVIDGDTKDVVSFIVNSFVDRDGRALSPDTVKTILTPARSEKRPKAHKKIDIDKKE